MRLLKQKPKKEEINKLYDGIITDPIKISIAVFALAFMLIVGITLYYGYYSDKFRENLLVESHGTLLDILLLGVFVVWLQQKGEKKKDNKRYVNEIDDFRGWDDEVASRKIRGNVRRLNANGIITLNLSNCSLKNMDLSGSVLTSSDFWGADLTNSDFSNSYLTGCNFEDAKLTGACFKGAVLIESVFSRTQADDVDFREADLEKTKFDGACLVDADCDGASFISATVKNSDLQDVNFWNADFRGSNFFGSNLDGAHLKGANLLQVEGLNATQLSKCSLWMAKLEPKLLKIIKEEYPELLEEPEGDGW